LAIGALPEVNGMRDDPQSWPHMVANYVLIPEKVKTPAVVLFRYRPGVNFHQEPVYNVDVAWPDDAPIIRAHDLGARNAEIIDYYARTQPDRVFYLFDMGNGSLTEIGMAGELAKQLMRGPGSPQSMPAGNVPG
jgi:hypothetical protein